MHKNNQLNLITIYIGLVNARVTSDSPLCNRARLIVSKKKTDHVSVRMKRDFKSVFFRIALPIFCSAVQKCNRAAAILLEF